MRVLECPSQDYAWGSADDIPAFLGREGVGRPMAEVWMGTHPLGPAMVQTESGPAPLGQIAGELPFMMKILAADKPLSIQVHPNAELAQQGFEAEQAAGIALDAPHRVYKDPFPKPEMVYALTAFDTLVGFRPTAEILRILTPLDHPVIADLVEQLTDNPGFHGIVRLVERLLLKPPSAGDVDEIVALCQRSLQHGVDVKRAYATAVEIAPHYPGDVGVVISLMLNRLTLQPGEAAYLGAGIIHAHLKGMCLEVMVCSDNVLRAGLTPKHLDPEGLVRALDASMSRLARVDPQLYGFSTDIFAPGEGEFALSVTQSSPAESAGIGLPDAGRRLLVCTGGDIEVTNSHGQTVALGRGDVVFAGPDDGQLTVTGTGEVAQAYSPDDDTHQGRMHDLV